jgi:hypothetical protein
MSEALLALEPLRQAASEHEANLVGPDVVHLGKLGLFVRVRPLQIQAGPNGALYIAEFDASTDRSRPGMVITCVGLSRDAAGAGAEAAGHWYLGVLPVLAHWRGAGHSCFVGTTTLELPSSSGPLTFDVIKGPVIERGEHDAGTDAAPSTDAYLSLLTEPLRGARLGRRRHWLECFAIRAVNGTIDATCRLDNRDWAPGKKRLADDARGWPGTTPSFHSRRQFLLLLPQGGGPEEPEPRSFWARLFGRG